MIETKPSVEVSATSHKEQAQEFETGLDGLRAKFEPVGITIACINHAEDDEIGFEDEMRMIQAGWSPDQNETTDDAMDR